MGSVGGDSVIFGCTVTFGLLCWFVRIFTMTLMAAPLLVGLGVDDGIHVVHRMREKNAKPAAESAVLVGQPIVMTTLTTASSFGVMLFTDHPGMESWHILCCSACRCVCWHRLLYYPPLPSPWVWLKSPQ